MPPAVAPVPGHRNALLPAFPDGDLDGAVELGAVDDRSVRVWLRCAGVASVSVTLHVAGQPSVRAAVPLSADSDWTAAVTLVLAEPAPGAAFTVDAAGQTRHGRLSPAPGARAALTFGFGSCHMPFAPATGGGLTVRPAAAIYPAMQADLARLGADFLLLAGDQIYSDIAPWLSVPDALTADATPGQMLAAYRAMYRGFFGERHFRALRAAFPAYCMWDDHEIENNWGALREDGETARDRLRFDAAVHAYREYQHSRNPGTAGAPPFWYAFLHGDIGVLALDVRGRRSWAEGRHLGRAQWAAVRGWLHGPQAAIATTLFVVSSVPVAHASRWFVRLLERLPVAEAASLRDRWCSSAFLAERDELLAELFGWQAAGLQRKVVVLSGDIHAGMAATIRQRRGPGLIHQWTSSAFTTPRSARAEWLNRAAMQFPNLGERDVRFRHSRVVFAGNYGIVRALPLSGGGHRLRFVLRVWDEQRRRSRSIINRPA